MVYYGYIIVLEEFTPAPNDIQWVFKRYNEDGSQTEYNGIETTQDYSGDSNLDMKGSNVEFSAWANEFAPEVL